MAVVLLVLHHCAVAGRCSGLNAQVYPNGSTRMTLRLMLPVDRNGDEPPARAIGNRCAHDLALETQFLGHVDIAQLRNMEGMPINRKFIVGQVEAQCVSFLTLEARKAR